MQCKIGESRTTGARNVCNWSRRDILNAHRLLKRKLGNWSFSSVEDPERLSDVDKSMMAMDMVRQAMWQAFWRPKRYFFPEVRGGLDSVLESMIRHSKQQMVEDSFPEIARRQARTIAKLEGEIVTDARDKDNFKASLLRLRRCAENGDIICKELLKFEASMDILDAKLRNSFSTATSGTDVKRSYAIYMVRCIVGEALAQPGKIKLPPVTGTLDETLEGMISAAQRAHEETESQRGG